ncbi:T9SS type A sorting domain-containing protein [Flavobacterium phragmitis]|uniref:Por secretion system C-terminal sorting domain-containing protein n=1 Tax=Flavobacterium phragmitis TaxID=739143 RepID=A0A1I1MQV0_9FLAO|nr:T9SS type A sorting domain-containing protein [Flavobacterium phragmitis]SFC85548.1 Por secretion system C-terminal sorting domain-containing protein [Flavobacterium phragmitis]
MKKIMKLSLVCAVLLTGISTYAIDGNEALNLHVLKGNGKVIAFGINQLQKAVISIYDTNGSLIYTENASGKDGILRTFSLEEFPQGKYILEVADNYKKVKYDITVDAKSSVLSSKGTTSLN